MGSDYIVSARKYRPATFASVVGQQALTRTLKNAISSGRLAQAYLFCGPRGVGKTSCARIFAKTINCRHRTPEGEACGVCESCVEFQRGQSYNIIELDAASNNGVDQMRSLTEQVNVPPEPGAYRIFIIDEVHMLSPSAFNAFLKTLEEPPAYAVFILATTEKNKVLPTILSRCQIYDFSRITNADIAAHLAYVAESEGIVAESMALEVIARKADGAMRDALSIFDQVAASADGKVTYQAAIDSLNVLDYEYYFRFCDAFGAGDVARTLLLYKEVRDKGFDARFFINGLAVHLRNLLVALTPATAGLLEVGDETRSRYLEQAQAFDAGWYYSALTLLNDCDLNFRNTGDPQLLVEVTLIRVCQLSGKVPAPMVADPGDAPMQALVAAGPASAGAPSASAAVAPPAAKAAEAISPVVSRVAPAPVRRPVRGTARPAARSLRLKDAAAPAQRTENPSEAAADTAHTGPEEKSEPEPVAKQPDANGVDREKLEGAWLKFIGANPTLHILINAMRATTPEMRDGSTLVYGVSNQAQYNEACSHAGVLADFMRRELGMSGLTVSCELRESAPRAVRLTDGELLAKLVADNPAMGALLRDLDAEQV